MRKMTVLTALLAATALLETGCLGRAISEGVGAVKGAKGVWLSIQPVETSLDQYTQFRVEPFADNSGVGVPAEVKARLAHYVQQELASKKIHESASGPELIIRGTYIYYEDSTKVISEVFGPFEEVIARVQLVDAATGRVLGEADCVGRSTTTVNQGTSSKAEGLAKGIVGWIAKNRARPAD